MKKSLIALAVAAGSIAAAQADTTTLYGSLGFSSVIGQTQVEGTIKDAENVVKSVKDTHWDIATSTSKFGIKGDEDLGNGTKAFFKFEFGADPKAGINKTSYAYLGFKGDFGTVTIGKQKSLLKAVTDTGLFQEVGVGYGFSSSDDFYAITGYDKDKSKGKIGYPGTVSKAVSYVTPASAGLQLGASVVADNGSYNSTGADAWEVAAMYNVDGWNTGLVYTHVAQGERYDENGKAKVRSKGANEFIGLNVGYGTDQYNIVGRAVHESSIGTEYGLEGEYIDGPNTFRLGVGAYDAKKSGVDNVYNVALGYQYNFSQRTYTWVEGQYTDLNNNKDSGFKALVGVRHDF